MTDIAERLRAIRDGEEIERLATEIEQLQDDTQMLWDAVAEKNAEIERLRELEVLVKHYQDRLRTIAKHPDTPELIRQYAVGLLNSEGMPVPDFKIKREPAA